MVRPATRLHALRALLARLPLSLEPHNAPAVPRDRSPHHKAPFNAHHAQPVLSLAPRARRPAPRALREPMQQQVIHPCVRHVLAIQLALPPIQPPVQHVARIHTPTRTIPHASVRPDFLNTHLRHQACPYALHVPQANMPLLLAVAHAPRAQLDSFLQVAPVEQPPAPCAQ